MSDINWDQLAEKAASQTDAIFNKEIASLCSLKTPEVELFIKESSISNENALKTLKTINDATLANNEKAATISNIKSGVNFLVKLASKLV